MTQGRRQVGLICGTVTLLSVYALPAAAQDAPNGSAGSGAVPAVTQAGGGPAEAVPAGETSDRVTAGSSSSVSGVEGARSRPAIESQAIQRRGRSWLTRGETRQEPRKAQSGWLTDGLWALGVVLGLIMLMALGLKRWGGRLRMAVGGGDENMEMVSRLALSSKQSVCVIRLGRQLVVVGVTPDQITALSTIDDPDMVAELTTRRTREAAASFDRLFSSEAASYEPYVDEEEAAVSEIPLDEDDRSRYARARLEISGLLDKLRRRGGRDEEPPGPDTSQDDRNTIAVA